MPKSDISIKSYIYFKTQAEFFLDTLYLPAYPSFYDLGFMLMKNNLVTTIKKLSRTWFLSIDIKPYGTRGIWSNVMHASINANHGQHGYRTPAIFFHGGSTNLYICSSVNNEENHCIDTDNIPLNSYTNVQIKQAKINDNTYVYSIQINGTILFATTLSNTPREFHNVKVYLSNGWEEAAKAEIKNFLFMNIE